MRPLHEDDYSQFPEEDRERIRYNRQVNKLKALAEQFKFSIDWGEHEIDWKCSPVFFLMGNSEFISKEYSKTYQGINDAIAWLETREERFALNALLGDIAIDL